MIRKKHLDLVLGLLDLVSAPVAAALLFAMILFAAPATARVSMSRRLTRSPRRPQNGAATPVISGPSEAVKPAQKESWRGSSIPSSRCRNTASSGLAMKAPNDTRKIAIAAPTRFPRQ